MTPARCQSCQAPLPAGQRFCGSCGAKHTPPAPPGLDATATSVSDTRDHSPFAAAPDDDARFPPGTMIAERYRIVGLIGRGGMGEVYRADDLTLGTPVALKFLPESVERDPARLGRFLNEARTALKVSHPNVCRVHDINQIAGRHFLSMEFVDGDDLAALLRRIGRLPSDKALEITRQLCAGLAAAHGGGILHRDLKPANVMIDGRGQVKITDFGLAGAAGEIAGDEVRAGTPAYMAPEQLAGKQVSNASDIYALGLVLYEVYTGKPAYEGATRAEIQRRSDTVPTSPSSYVEDLDPAVERVIMRCLESDPNERPRSALAVAAALPGGDPLAAALAAGETPAPELVAEAGAAGGLRPQVAMACLVAVVLGLVLAIGLSGRVVLIARAALPKAPAVLQEKAREILVDLGYDDPPGDSLFEFEANKAYLAHLRDLDTTGDRWDAVASYQPAAVRFGYRQDPGLIRYETDGALGTWLGRSPSQTPGAVRLKLDPLGRLVWLNVVPPERALSVSDATAPESAPASEPQWHTLLEAAGFDPTELTEVEPTWNPPVWADRRRAWDGVYPDAPEVSVHVEAAALDGRPVSLRIVDPWTRPLGAPQTPAGFWAVAGEIVNSLWFSVVVLFSALVAWRNVRLGRGDRKTAVRFALLLAAIRFVWLTGAHHVPSAEEIGIVTGHLAWSMYRFAMVYIFYLALEPYARKLWPRMLASWVRLFQGRLRDPLVGRDLLVGTLFGVVFALAQLLMMWIPERLQLPGYGLIVDFWSHETLRGFRATITSLAGLQTAALLNIFIGLMAVFLLRRLLRRTWITVVVVTLLGIVNFNPGVGHPAPYLVMIALTLGIFWFIFFRFGLLATVLGYAIAEAVRFLPLTFDLSAWWSGATWLVVALCLGIAGWGFWVALAGRPVFRDQILERG